VLQGGTAPTSTTIGAEGQCYIDTTNQKYYICTSVDTTAGTYVWTLLTSIQETLSITSSSWEALSASTPYTYKATATITTTLIDNSIVELFNNNAILFAKYGFAIGNIDGQTATIYSIGQPNVDVNLVIGIGG
jgi:hypothetical protein